MPGPPSFLFSAAISESDCGWAVAGSAPAAFRPRCNRYSAPLPMKSSASAGPPKRPSTPLPTPTAPAFAASAPTDGGGGTRSPK